jgi:hypothetical protein
MPDPLLYWREAAWFVDQDLDAHSLFPSRLNIYVGAGV